MQALPATPPGKATVLSSTICVVVEPEPTRPLLSILYCLLSWTFIISPGLKKAAFIPVEKLTSSVSWVSTAKCQSANLFAWDSEVHPYAVISLEIIFPVFSIFEVSSTVKTVAL